MFSIVSPKLFDGYRYLDRVLAAQKNRSRAILRSSAIFSLVQLAAT